jgi:hypothetical protein
VTPGAILVIAVICALAGLAIGRPKGRAGQGFALGLLLGIIGIVIIACLKTSRETLIRQEQDKIAIRQEAEARAAGAPGVQGGVPGGALGAWREARREPRG